MAYPVSRVAIKSRIPLTFPESRTVFYPNPGSWEYASRHRKQFTFQLLFIFVFKLGPSGQPLLVYDMSVNCTSFYMQVEFILKSSYLDTETFRFDNKSCGSHTVTSEHVSLRTPLDACGTTKKDGEDSVTYFNKIVAETADKETIYIVEFPFSCTYGVRETIGSPSFQPRKKITYLKGKVQLLDSLSSYLRSAN